MVVLTESLASYVAKILGLVLEAVSVVLLLSNVDGEIEARSRLQNNLKGADSGTCEQARAPLIGRAYLSPRDSSKRLLACSRATLPLCVTCVI